MGGILFCARIWSGVFLIGKTTIGRFSNKESARARICSGATRPGLFSTQRLQIREDWVLSTQSSPAVCAFGGWSRPEDGRVRRIFSARIWVGPGFRYTEIADSWRLDFIYTEIADTLVLAGL